MPKAALEVVLSEVAKALEPLAEAAREEPLGTGILRLLHQTGCSFAAGPDETALRTLALAIPDAYAPISHLTGGNVSDALGGVATMTALDRLLDVTKAIGEDLAQSLFDYLLISYLEREHPLVHSILALLGIFSGATRIPGGAASDKDKYAVHWKRFGELLSNPGAVFRELYGWGTADLNSNMLLHRIHDLLWSLSVPSSLLSAGERNTDGILHVLGGLPFDLSFQYLPPRDGQPPGIIGTPSLSGKFSRFWHVARDWVLLLAVSAEVESNFGLALRPGGTLAIETLEGSAFDWSINAVASLARSGKAGENVVLFGNRDGTRLEADSLTCTCSLTADAEGGEFRLEAGLVGGQLVVQPRQGDSFLQKLLPSEPFQLPFEGAIGWSSRKGFYFKGSDALETSIPVRLGLGPIRVESIYLKLAPAGKDAIGLTVAGSLNARLGILQLSVDKVGLEAIFGLSPPDVRFRFKPPSGIGILIDAGALTGGGFLSIDEASGRYSGILELEIEQISIKAIGILDTRLPGGVRGFSFLILLFSEFPPMQLGWGFNLSGVGGLAGIHRTADLAALQAGVRSNGLDSILFPQNPVANAPKILSDLQTFFPPALNRFVFGPMALVGWGTPPVINAELGVLLELPAPVRLAILGKINLGFPSLELDPKLRAIDLHLDILGTVDFSQKLLAIDATLHDSRIGIDPEAFSIEGDMALRLSWGKPPIFALAVGGFHPHFPTPEGFPSLRRMTIAFPTSPKLQMTMHAYAALTANTAQFGATVDFQAEVSRLSIQGTLGFDSLFTFHPFSLAADLAGSVAFRKGGSYLGTVNLDAHLTGPTPWHVWGKASLSTMFGRLSVPFDALFGKAQQEVVLPPSDPWPLLQAALADPRNWSSALPTSASRIVTIVAPSGSPPAIILDPAGSVTVSEKVLPLDQRITKFGETTPSGPDHYSIEGVKLAGAPIEGYTAIQDYFALAQFIEMNDSDKLSNESFTLMHSGVKLTDPVEHGTSIGTAVVFETMILDFPGGSRSEPDYVPSQDQQISSLDQGIVSRSPLRTAGLLKFGPKPTAVPPVTLREETFVIATKIDAMVRTDISAPVSVSQATRVLSDYVAAHPSERGSLQLVPLHEVEGLT